MTPHWMQRPSGLLWRAAQDILNTATQVTPDVVWACGPYLAMHALRIAWVWEGRSLIDSHSQLGGSMDAGWFQVGGGRVTFSTKGRTKTRFMVPLKQIGQLVAKQHLTAELIAAVDAALAERAEVTAETADHNQRELRSDNPPSREETDAHFAWYSANEHRCDEAAAAVWAHVRPAPAKPVQLGLFDLAAAS